MEEELHLLQFLAVIAKRKLLIVFGTLIALFASIAATAYMNPTYEASTRIIVTQGQVVAQNQTVNESYEAVLLSERLAKTFSEMVKRRPLAERVIENLQLAMVPEDLIEKVSSEPIRDTQLIEVVAVDKNPVLAKELANAVTFEFAKMVEEVMPETARVSVKVVEPAVVPLAPSKPKPLLYAVLALIVGFMASIGLAFLLETLDVTVKDSDEAERLLGLPALGNIPRVENPYLLSNGDHRSSEAFRSMRTNLQYVNHDQSIKTFVVTSANMGEGKSTVTANLGIVLAQSGQKVLIVDCDLRSPGLSSLFGRKEVSGLSNVLIGVVGAESVISTTAVDGLCLMASGPMPPNPADLLNSARMDTFLEEFQDKFDYIILDSPPVIDMADAAILAVKADAVMLLTSMGKTKKNELAAAKDTFDKVGARIIGFALNSVQPRTGQGVYYYQNGYALNSEHV